MLCLGFLPVGIVLRSENQGHQFAYTEGRVVRPGVEMFSLKDYDFFVSEG